MAKRGEKSVSIKGLSEKRNITRTFVITLAGEFLPLQIIYGGKTDATQEIFNFLQTFVFLTRNIGLTRKKPLN